MKKHLLSLLSAAAFSLLAVACSSQYNINHPVAEASSGNPQVLFSKADLKKKLQVNNGVSTVRALDGFKQVSASLLNVSNSPLSVSVKTVFTDANQRIISESPAQTLSIPAGQSAFYKDDSEVHGVKDFIIIVD